MDKGILLIGLGRHYCQLAYNMAKSIKRFNDISIACITEEDDETLLEAFDEVIIPKIGDYMEGYAFNPFKLKTFIYDYTPFKHTIYLDVDGIALKDIEALFKFNFKIQEVGRYKIEEAEKCHMVWAKKAGITIKDIFEAYKLDKERAYPEYNSSIIIFKKNRDNKKYFTQVKRNYLDRRTDFKDIGGYFPDELAFNLASIQLNHYNELPKIKPIYFQWENKTLGATDIEKKYYFLGMAGGFHSSRLKHIYEISVKQFSPYWRWDSMKKIFHKRR